MVPPTHVTYGEEHTFECIVEAHVTDVLKANNADALFLTQLGADEVRWHEEPGSEELATSARVRSALRGTMHLTPEARQPTVVRSNLFRSFRLLGGFGLPTKI